MSEGKSATEIVAEQERRRKLIQHCISELADPVKPLSKWEEDFLISVSDQFDRKGSLSDKQLEILERIYAEKTA